jgi:ubiquinone/menaquinone biosynthesis C-methylase UbiE
MIEEIKKYYDDLAPNYDSNRFENSYGKYIDIQERRFLKSILSSDKNNKILDLGCGTGRFLEFADYGVDISPKMIEVAKTKFPEKEISEGSVSSIPFPENHFDAIYSLHVIMHLNKEITQSFLDETHKKLKSKGKLIFDFPSEKRRKTVNYKANNWHAANQFSMEEIINMSETNWELKKYSGILFLPIHRFPNFIRPLFLSIDNLLCNSFLKEYASYIIIELEKK